MLTFPEKNKKFFANALSKSNEMYNEEKHALKTYLSKAFYHTKLYSSEAHLVRESFIYANALLATGDDADLLRAQDILWNLSRLQDKDPESKTFGIWSWYIEEPLSEMNPPDFNWADFCGKEIVQTLFYHKERISSDLKDYLEETLRCAAKSIAKRNMHPAYTNISIMGTYVALAAGKLLSWGEMLEYGRSRLINLHEYNIQNGTFAEYNSPTYTVEAITDLSRISGQIDDPEIHRLAEELLDLAWCTVSEHFHAPTKQWTGPCSRSYTWLTSDQTLSFLRYALDNGEALISDEKYVYSLQWPYVKINCPEKYCHAFTECTEHDVNIGFTRSPSLKDPKSHVAIAHITKKYTLASWQTESAWNQCRNLIGYWGEDKPRFINATILHDYYDFSSGMFVTAQNGGNALITASLISDGGDTHCHFDKLKNQELTARDLRVRIELGGDISHEPMVSDNQVILNDGGISLNINLLDAEFDGKKIFFEFHNTNDDIEEQTKHSIKHKRFIGNEMRRYIDLVFYHGESKTFSLNTVNNAYASICVSMENATPENVKLEVRNGLLITEAVMDGVKLQTVSSKNPTLQNAWRGYSIIDGVPMNETYGLPVPEDMIIF